MTPQWTKPVLTPRPDIKEAVDRITLAIFALNQPEGRRHLLPLPVETEVKP